jgi:hypothetical protein
LCNKSTPLDDYASNGIEINQNSTNILLQDLNIHGLTQQAIHGPYGASVVLNRVRMAFNGFAGWGFDDGQATPNGLNALLTATDVLVEWNGCNEEYPIVHTIPAASCYDTNSAGFGEGFSAQGSGSGGQTTQGSLICERCTFRYNTKDGFGMNHVLYNILSITDSASYGNMGQQWKWSSYDNSKVTFTNNLAVANCMRMSAPITGAPSNYNALLSGWCRADDGTAEAVGRNSTTLIANNTVIGYASTLFDMQCSSPVACDSSSIFTVSGNIVLAYSNPNYNAAQYSGTYWSPDGSTFVVNRDHNDYWNSRNTGCPTTGFVGEKCVDPLFVGEPHTFTQESDLDVFTSGVLPTLPSGSPLTGMGATDSGAVITPPILPPAPTTPTITWSSPAAIVYGTALSSTQLNAIASVPGSFTYSPAVGTVLATGTDILSVTFVPTDTTSFTNATAAVNITVTSPVIAPPSSVLPEACQVWFTIGKDGYITFTGQACNKVQ